MRREPNGTLARTNGPTCSSPGSVSPVGGTAQSAGV